MSICETANWMSNRLSSEDEVRVGVVVTVCTTVTDEVTLSWFEWWKVVGGIVVIVRRGFFGVSLEGAFPLVSPAEEGIDSSGGNDVDQGKCHIRVGFAGRCIDGSPSFGGVDTDRKVWRTVMLVGVEPGCS